jgi:hypothetical protein
MRSKCFIQRCKTVILWNGSASPFPTQFLRCNSRDNLSLHLNYYISWCYSVRYDKRILLERGLPYTLKSSNKQLMHTFLHFVVSLQSIFYTLGLIFVFDVNIYSYSLRLFKIDPVVSLLPATIRQVFHFSVVFAVTLASRYFCFKYLDRVKRVIFQASNIAKRLRINTLVIL